MRPVTVARYTSPALMLLVLSTSQRSYSQEQTRAAKGAPEQTTAGSGAGPTMRISPPSDTEVMQGERTLSSPLQQPTYPMDEPLDPERYICSSGDVFELNFWGRQNFNLKVTVDFEGRAFIPRIGYVDLRGRSLAQARQIVHKVVAASYPGLNFDLSLSKPRSFMVQVAENVARPGPYVATSLQRAGSVLAQAGGPTAVGSHRRIEIHRRDGTILPVDLTRYAISGDTKYNPYVLDGDVIRVPPEQMAVTVAGPVRRPGRYELIDSRDLSELFDLAGGFTSEATHELPLRIVRADASDRLIVETVPFPTSGPPSTSLHERDAVYVPTSAEVQSTIYIIGAIKGAVTADDVTAVKAMPFVEHDTARTLIERAGGVSVDADLARSYVRHRDGVVSPLDLDRLLNHRDWSADRELHNGDVVVIPTRRLGVAVAGAVMKAGFVQYNPQFSISQYLALSGGLTRQAKAVDQIKVTTPDGIVKSYRPHLQVLPGDVITVPERLFSAGEIIQIVIAGTSLALSAVAIGIAVR